MKSRIPILFAISMLIMPVIPVFSKSNPETVDSVSQVLRAMVVEMQKKIVDGGGDCSKHLRSTGII